MTIKELRKSVGMTQKELAKNVECSVKEIRNLEHDPSVIVMSPYLFVYNLWYYLIVNNKKVDFMDLEVFVNNIYMPAVHEI